MISQRILDLHCAKAGFILPRDPDAMRTWLVALITLAYQVGRAGHDERRIRPAAPGA
jgi:hypothetical protein